MENKKANLDWASRPYRAIAKEVAEARLEDGEEMTIHPRVLLRLIEALDALENKIEPTTVNCSAYGRPEQVRIAGIQERYAAASQGTWCGYPDEIAFEGIWTNNYKGGGKIISQDVLWVEGGTMYCSLADADFLINAHKDIELLLEENSTLKSVLHETEEEKEELQAEIDARRPVLNEAETRAFLTALDEEPILSPTMIRAIERHNNYAK